MQVDPFDFHGVASSALSPMTGANYCIEAMLYRHMCINRYIHIYTHILVEMLESCMCGCTYMYAYENIYIYIIWMSM